MITDPSGSETKDMKDRAATHNIILGIAALQFPLHVYSIFTLRSLNESLLISGSAEQEWGFGQIVAVILLGTNLVTLVNGFQGMLSSFCWAKFHSPEPLAQWITDIKAYNQTIDSGRKVKPKSKLMRVHR
jgi:hypothetical protein